VTFVVDHTVAEEAKKPPEYIPDEFLPQSVRRPLFESWNLPVFLHGLESKVNELPPISPIKSKSSPKLPLERLRIPPFSRPTRGLSRSENAAVTEQELNELVAAMDTVKQQFANLRMLGLPGPIFDCVIDWVPLFHEIRSKSFDLPVEYQLETLYNEGRDEIDYFIDELQLKDNSNLGLID
jgi:hypothetical protein